MKKVVRNASTLMLLLIQCLLIFPCFASDAKPLPVVRFAINTPGSPPYLYFDPEFGNYRGVVVDFFSSEQMQSKYSVRYLDSSRARNELLLLESKADVFLSAREWLDHANIFIFSDAIMLHASYMYSTTEFDGPFIPALNPNASVCTRYGYIYPVLQQYFAQKENGLIRMNSTSQATMATMLAKGRCDFAIMSEQNARSNMFSKVFCDTAFYQSPNIISGVDLVFVMRPGLAVLKQTIDQALVSFIESGALQASIEKHSGPNQFPKQTCSATE
ncbi:substrate-binding periplasmic protein [Alteromonas sp. D210916BOD_24]|uniref:substrate-binding periplasmic protein n=1 Tax=Alteromonas sp. D210916BOD_24 TaxID=3157618 RepID=UPI00399D5646